MPCFQIRKHLRSHQPTYDEVVAQFKDAPEPKLRELVAKARYNRGSSTTLDLSTRSANQP
jgi:hypothetical protein